MNNFFRFLSILVVVLILSSCSKNNDTFVPIPLRDYKEQFITDSTAIDTYFKTHKLIPPTVANNQTVSFESTTDLSASMRKLPHTYLVDTNVVEDGINYKFYYIKFNDGTQRRPTSMDSVYVNYRGTVLVDASTEFENSVNPVWFRLQELVTGLGHILPRFKTGTYESAPPNAPIFKDFGAGVVFLPSGLAYYDASAGVIPSYTPIAFSFKLCELRYRDHDRDGILTKDERSFGTLTATERWKVNPLNIDTDSDGVPDMYDIDDDNDDILTRVEIKNPTTGLPYAFSAIPACPADTADPTRKVHLSKSCK